MEDKNEQLEPEVENVEATEIPEIQETEESKIEKLELEVQEWKDSYTRKLAEFQNFSRRKENELAEFKKYASEEIILKVLDNVDNLERAIDSTKESKNFDSLVEGVDMILKNMKNLLVDEGVEEIEAEGKTFDPYEHQPMMTETLEEVENDTILQVFQKGYKLKGKVIRPSMVKINKK
jgi:molecular chaperone GrpE